MMFAARTPKIILDRVLALRAKPSSTRPLAGRGRLQVNSNSSQDATSPRFVRTLLRSGMVTDASECCDGCSADLRPLLADCLRSNLPDFRSCFAVGFGVSEKFFDVKAEMRYHPTRGL